MSVGDEPSKEERRGGAPLGYLNKRRFDDGREVRTITVDPERAEHIIWAFDTYATGEWSVTRLAGRGSGWRCDGAELEARGLTTRPGPNTPAGPLTVNGLHRPYYKGVVVLNGVEHTGRHEPLIDAVTWASVQDILTSRRNGKRSRAHDHYLKGTVFCLECGRRLIVQRTRTKTSLRILRLPPTPRHHLPTTQGSANRQSRAAG